LFGNGQPLEVEIGFGNGEYLARLCEEQPAANFVGFEEYCERISRTLRKLSRAASGNVRVMRLDVRPGFTYLFAPRTIEFIHCLFPPPWPKKSDIKHRLFTPDFLRLCNNRLKDGGGFKIVTDHKPLAEWIEEQVPGTGFSWKQTVIPASYGTKFERKWAEGGQTEFYEILLTKIKHQEIAPKQEAALNHYDITGFEPGRFKMEDFSGEGIAVACKDFLYDAKRQMGQVHVLVHDEHLLQNVRVSIYNSAKGWKVNLAPGSMLMPTAGIAKALALVRDAAAATVE
jgi:tRNA (guanine-N7-)-methyltransferase